MWNKIFIIFFFRQFSDKFSDNFFYSEYSETCAKMFLQIFLFTKILILSFRDIEKWKKNVFWRFWTRKKLASLLRTVWSGTYDQFFCIFFSPLGAIWVLSVITALKDAGCYVVSLIRSSTKPNLTVYSFILLTVAALSQLRICRTAPPPLQKWPSSHKRCAMCRK